MPVVKLPTLHGDQVRAFKVKDPKTGKRPRFLALRCGRRWGKTEFEKTLVCDAAAKGWPVGWFAPDYKRSSEAFSGVEEVLKPIKASSSKVEGIIRTKTSSGSSRGSVEFWTLEDESAGRSRRYKLVVIDEAAFTKPNMMGIWEKSILPTLLDFQGLAVVASNTNGIDGENFLYQICTDPRYDFTEFHAPSINNPTIPIPLPNETPEAYMARRQAIFDDIRAKNHPLVFQQEYLAEFVDWSGVAFFSKDKLLDNGEPVPYPRVCEGVFAVVDSAVKTGKDNDGTAVIYFAIVAVPVVNGVERRLVVLDWDIQQVEGDMLIEWVPNVYRRLEELAAQCIAVHGALPLLVEDRQSGSILLQQCARRGFPVEALPEALTSIGKDERAISASPHHFQGRIKISRPAYEKATMYKGQTRNHLLGQVVGFRIGDKDAARRADDLLDCYTYGVGIALGGTEGI